MLGLVHAHCTGRDRACTPWPQWSDLPATSCAPARLAGRLAEALELQQRALAALPDVPAQQVLRAEVLIERAQAERALGRPDAAATFDRAIELLRAAQLQPTPALAEARVGAGRDR